MQQRVASARYADGAEWDAIVVGAGATGGLAALLLARAGLDVLVLDAGWAPRFRQDPVRVALGRGLEAMARLHNAEQAPDWLRGAGRRLLRGLGRLRQPVQSTCFAWTLAPQMYVDDRDAPYATPDDAPFTWIRSWQVGGRAVVPNHGHLHARMAPWEFGGTGEVGAWPIALSDLEPWYETVEGLLGLPPPEAALRRSERSGSELRQTGEEAGRRLRGRWQGLGIERARSAPPLAAMALARATGRVECREGAVVRRLLLDRDGAVAGVSWFDRQSGSEGSAGTRLVFLAASAIESARILMQTGSSRHPDGIAARSGALGRYLVDHLLVRGFGTGAAFDSDPEQPAPEHCLLVPRMDLREGAGATLPYTLQIHRYTSAPGRASFIGASFARMEPRRENGIALERDRHDRFGRKVIRISCRLGPGEREAARQQQRAIRECAEALGVGLRWLDRMPPVPGAAVHEAGVARMGRSPDTSVADPFGQCWDVPGAFVVDAAVFPSLPIQAPTLTSMALAARAVDHSLRQRGHAGLSSSLPARMPASAAG